MTRWHAAVAALAAGACSVTPLSNRIAVGEEAFVVFVAEGRDGMTDLFATPIGGGMSARLTFTPLAESSPALSRAGDVLAFLRGADTLPGTPRDLVVMNLLNGAERVLPLPPEAGSPRRVAWAADHGALYVATTAGTWRLSPPPADPDPRPVSAADRAAADTALATWLGTPRFARAVPCPDGAGICVQGPSGDTARLAPAGRDPFRWGGDSVGWFDGDDLYVRGLGPSRARPIRLGDRDRVPRRPREGTHAAP